jgi:cell division protein FtsL
LLAARDLAAELRPARRYESPRRTRSRPKAAAKPRSKAAWLSLWVLVVAVAFSVTYRHAALTRLGYEAEGLERELAALRKQNGELEVHVSSLGSLGRVEQLAKSRLGMVAPRQTIVVALDLKGGGGGLDLAGAGAGAGAGAAVLAPVALRPAVDDGGGALTRLWRLVRRLAGVPAEAAVPIR